LGVEQAARRMSPETMAIWQLGMNRLIDWEDSLADAVDAFRDHKASALNTCHSRSPSTGYSDGFLDAETA
jgi:hypothetical protein